jgi:hypothetical protein
MIRINDRASIDNWPYITIGASIAIALGAVWLYTLLGVGVVMHQSLYQYRLQSGNLDELHRFAPVVETQMRELPVLKDVSLDSQLKSEAIVRGVALADAIVQIHDMEIRLALPATITTSLAKTK